MINCCIAMYIISCSNHVCIISAGAEAQARGGSRRPRAQCGPGSHGVLAPQVRLRLHVRLPAAAGNPQQVRKYIFMLKFLHVVHLLMNYSFVLLFPQSRSVVSSRGRSTGAVVRGAGRGDRLYGHVRPDLPLRLDIIAMVWISSIGIVSGGWEKLQ